MNQENEVLANFQVEELEKRFEMGWLRKKPSPFDGTPVDGIKIQI